MSRKVRFSGTESESQRTSFNSSTASASSLPFHRKDTMVHFNTNRTPGGILKRCGSSKSDIMFMTSSSSSSLLTVDTATQPLLSYGVEYVGEVPPQHAAIISKLRPRESSVGGNPQIGSVVKQQTATTRVATPTLTKKGSMTRPTSATTTTTPSNTSTTSQKLVIVPQTVTSTANAKVLLYGQFKVTFGISDLLIMLGSSESDDSVSKPCEQHPAWLPIHFATLGGNLPYLLKSCPHDTPTNDDKKYYCTHIAAMVGKVGLLEWFATTFPGCLLHKTRHGQSIAHVAAAHNRVEVLMFLHKVSGIVDMSSVDDSGFNIAHVAAQHGHVDVLRYLHQHLSHDGDELFMAKTSASKATIVHLAAKHGHVAVLQFIHSIGMWDSFCGSPAVEMSKEGTPLYVAVNNERWVVVTYLLEVTPPTSWSTRCTKMKRTFIHMAAAHGYVTLLKVVSAIRPDLIRDKDRDGNSISHIAAEKGQVAVLSWLVENPTFSDFLLQTNNRGDTVLHVSVHHKDFLDIFHLVASTTKCDTILRTRNENSKTVLDMCREDQLECLSEVEKIFAKLSGSGGGGDGTVLQSLGAPYYSHSPFEATYSFWRLNNFPIPKRNRSGSFSTTVLLMKNVLEYMADPLQPKPCGVRYQEHIPARHTAWLRNERPSAQTLNALPDPRVDVTMFSETYFSIPMTSMHFAAWACPVHVLQQLVQDDDGDISSNADGWRPVHFAILSGNVDAVKYITQKDSYVLEDFACGMWPLLHLALSARQLNVFRFFADHPRLSSTALSQVCDCQSYTLMHVACDMGINEAFEILKSKLGNACLREEDDEGATPAHIAALRGNLNIVQNICTTLGDEEITKFITEDKGRNIAHYAACGGSVNVLRWIVTHQSPNITQLISACDNHKNTIFHLAARHDHTNVITEIPWPPQSVARMMSGNDEGMTPAHIAAQWGSITFVKSLWSLLGKGDAVKQFTEVKDSHGHRAVYYVNKNHHRETRTYLQSILIH